MFAYYFQLSHQWLLVCGVVCDLLWWSVCNQWQSLVLCLLLIATTVVYLCVIHVYIYCMHSLVVMWCCVGIYLFGVHQSVFPLCSSDYLFKLLLIGDSGVGKSCLLLRFAVSVDTSYSTDSMCCDNVIDSLSLSLSPLRMTHTQIVTSVLLE